MTQSTNAPLRDFLVCPQPVMPASPSRLILLEAAANEVRDARAALKPFTPHMPGGDYEEYKKAIRRFGLAVNALDRVVDLRD